MELGDLGSQEAEQNWCKLERAMKKVGLKNGLSDGREGNFQKSFDKGYKDGFKNGFLLGELKFNSQVENRTHPLLNNINQGLCIVCLDEKENKSVSDVQKKQTIFVESNIRKINE